MVLVAPGAVAPAGGPKPVAALAEVVAAVSRWIERHGLPRDGEPLLVGCSGGGDSTALLRALASLGRFRLRAIYVDHGLRPGTDREAALVADLAAQLGAGFECATVTVGRRGNLLAAAREARYPALAFAARRFGARCVAVGHTASDQAETVAFRAERGDPPCSLAGIPAVRWIGAGPEAVAIVRPLLGVSRAHAAAATADLPVVDDPGNHRLDRARTRLRAALAASPPAAYDLLRAIADAATAWNDRLARRAEALGPLDALSASAVAAAGEHVALHLLRRAGLSRAGRAHARALCRLCAQTAGSRALDLGGGIVAARTYQRLRLGIEPPEMEALQEVAVPGPGVYPFAGGALEVGAAGRDGFAIDPARHPWPWTLRAPRPGDRLATRAGGRTLQDLLVDRKVPRPLRGRTPVLVGRDGALLWVGGIGAAAARPGIDPGSAIPCFFSATRD